MSLLVGAIVIAVAVYAIARRVDVRLVLLLAALVLGLLALNPAPVVIAFFQTFANERFVVPICCAMGFAFALRKTGCDQHLVHFLVRPLVKVRWLLIPGTIVAGFVVNIPIISQTSSAATLGPVAIPILAAARLKPATIGAVLLLGCSIGGELLNPGAPELRTVVEESRKLLAKQRAQGEPGFMDPADLTEHFVVQRILPLDLLALGVATMLFWYLARREESQSAATPDTAEVREPVEEFRLNYFKAAIPFVPLALLFATGPPLNLIRVPPEWLVSGATSGNDVTGLYNSRLIGLAMLIGVVLAAAASWRQVLEVPRAFFDGAGYAFANIVSLIVTANCFGEAIKQIGYAKLLGELIEANPYLLFPAGGGLSLGFAALSGSGMAATTSLFGFFVAPAAEQGVDPTLVGAVVSLASAAGRTMSPAAAVCLMCATLTDTSPMALVRRVAPPLLAGVVVVVATAFVMAQAGA